MKIVITILIIHLLGSNCIYAQSKDSINFSNNIEMKNVLEELSLLAIKLNDFEFEQDSSGWIGYKPATDEQIRNAEKRLNIKLPDDFKEFLKVSNGFPSVNTIEPSFLSVSQIDYTKNLDPFLIEIWTDESAFPKELTEKYERSITVGGVNEEQMFMLIPPLIETDKWEYWFFANWVPGEEPCESLKQHFISAIEFCKEEINKN
jgi:hypothetical protein